MNPRTQTILRAWGIFLFQIFVLIVSIAIFILIYRYIRALLKRVIFLVKINVFCKKNHIQVRKTKLQLLSVFKNTKSPELIIENNVKRYVIKFFTPTIVKNVNLNFVSPNYYFLTNVKGYVLLTRNAGSLIKARFFKPKNIEDTFLKMTHKELVEKVKGQKYLPPIDFEKYKSSEKITENILMITPVPLNMKYINANRFDALMSGDKYANFKVYSTNEFYLEFVRNNS